MFKFLPLLAVSVLMSCGAARQPKYAVSCMFEVDAPGSYVSAAGPVATNVVPGEGGTAEGAAALNACIQAKAAQDGVPFQTVIASNQTSKLRKTPEGQVVRDYSYGTPPSAAAVAPRYPAPGVVRSGSSPICPRRASVMYGGSGYCVVE
ncbi:hypothetical protein [Thalassovita mangrovi]|uniref:Lipoprotein n=1 Tax=Thalassovita mangrovi TaxID=2692236 RepID=A0A6L8LLW5_9RHOB|nr:hypothetical protein [Thalassovita mangrovi]MYM57027.1 hypothetical protein [Thalassovita mangrovi]